MKKQQLIDSLLQMERAMERSENAIKLLEKKTRALVEANENAIPRQDWEALQKKHHKLKEAAGKTLQHIDALIKEQQRHNQASQ